MVHQERLIGGDAYVERIGTVLVDQPVDEPIGEVIGGDQTGDRGRCLTLLEQSLDDAGDADLGREAHALDGARVLEVESHPLTFFHGAKALVEPSRNGAISG